MIFPKQKIKEMLLSYIAKINYIRMDYSNNWLDKYIDIYILEKTRELKI